MIGFDYEDWRNRMGHWTSLAKCSEDTHNLFFSKYKKEQQIAKSICQTCPVSLDCLQFAIENECTYGIYGGLTSQERERYGAS